MLKTFDVAELRPGMHVQRLLGPWMQHPFWRTSFVLDEARLAQLQDSGVQQVVVDLARSQLDDEPFADGVPPEAPAGAQEADAAAAESERRRVVVPDGRPDFAAELARARRICGDARDAVEAMFREARLGRGVDAGQAMPLIDEITGSVDRHPTALVSVARLKDADSYTYLHSVAVSALMVMLGREIGLTDAQLRAAEEFDVIRQHPVHGERLLREGGITQEGVLHITRHHHERVDGTGYPDRLPGSALPVLTRMGAICDVYDAITSNRPYKAGWDPGESLRRMAGWQGHFDADLLKAFVRSLGIYPVGTLVRLSSDRLAVVVEQNPATLLAPRVRVFYSAKSRTQLLQVDIDLAASEGRERILGIESPEKWGFRELEKLWLP